MNANAIGNGTGNISTLTPTSRGLDSLRSEDFFKLLITQLQQQDPFKPNDSNQLVQEMSTIREMETNNSLNKTLATFADQQKIGGATNLIGKYVTGVVRPGGANGSSDGQTQHVEGVVAGVRFSTTGVAVLELADGKQLLAQDVDSVRLPDAQTPAPSVTRVASADSTTTPETPAPQSAAGNSKADDSPQAARARSLAADWQRWLHPTPTAIGVGGVLV